jgi:WD40 repeat protein
MSGIFISYRREDSAPYTGRLYDRLAAHFGKDRVFMDLDDVRAGDDFVEVIDERIQTCDVLLAVIGRDWLTITDDKHRRRLAVPGDHVRQEIVAAMTRNVRIIPVLVGGTSMPRANDLPKALRDLGQRNAVEVTDRRFQADVESLIQDLERSVKPRAARPMKISQILPLRVLKAHANGVNCVGFSPTGAFLASGSGSVHSRTSGVRYWRVSNGEHLARIDYGGTIVHSVAFSPDGELLAIGAHSASLRSVREGTRLRHMEQKGRQSFDVYCLAFSADGQTLFGGSADQTVTAWSVSDGSILRRYGTACKVYGFALSKDGALIAAGCDDGRVRVFQTEHRKPAHVLEGHTRDVTSVAMTADGELIASGSTDGTVRLWRVSDGYPVRLFDCGSSVWSVVFSRDDRILVAGADDHRIRAWRVEEDQLLSTLEGHSRAVRAVAFSLDGKTLASGSDDATVRLWAAG